MGLPVEIDVETSTQVVRKGVDHDVEDCCGEDPFSSHRGKVGLALSTETNLPLGLIAAELLAQVRVLCEDAEDEEVEFGVLSNTRGAICMVQKIGGQGEEACERRFLVLFFRGSCDQVIAEKLVRIGEVVGCEKDSSLLGRTGGCLSGEGY